MAEDVIKVRGGSTLTGQVDISGAKNSAVALIPASLMAASGTVRLEGLPEISDVKTLMSLLNDLNIKTDLSGTTLEVNAEDAVNMPLSNNKVQSLRASYYMMGACSRALKNVLSACLADVRSGQDRLISTLKGLKHLVPK